MCLLSQVVISIYNCNYCGIMMSLFCCFCPFLYNYKESNRCKYPRIQWYKSAIGNPVKEIPDNTCTPTIIEVQLRISEKFRQHFTHTNFFDKIIK